MQQRQGRHFLGSAAAVLIASGCAHYAVFRTDDIPDALLAPANQLLTQQAHARGVQIYQCKSSMADATRFEWVLVGPEATLFDRTGAKMGKHYAGPTWEGLDGSRVVGQVAARVNSPDGHSIPWLLLNAKSTSGKGQFGEVVSIQRVHTAGGDAPSSCSDQEADKERRVSYTADYFFYVGPR